MLSRDRARICVCVCVCVRVRVTDRVKACVGGAEASGGEVACVSEQVEPSEQIKKKSFSQSAHTAVQSSDLICFQEQSWLLLSCCASNREAVVSGGGG